MSIRNLFQKNSEDIIQDIFKDLPQEIDCFSVSCGMESNTGLYLSSFNSFDNSLDYQNIDRSLGSLREKAFRIIQRRHDDEIHILFLRNLFPEKITFDIKESKQKKSLVMVEHVLAPDNVVLHCAEIITDKFPLFTYNQNSGIHTENPKVGFTVYRSIEYFEKAIALCSQNGSNAAKDNYRKFSKALENYLSVV